MLRKLFLILLGGLFFYGAGVTVIRMRITEMAYEFEQLKITERNHKEEQVRLKSMINQKLSPENLAIQGFGEPEPYQVMVIP